jgi:micrococcal nuclease
MRSVFIFFIWTVLGFLTGCVQPASSASASNSSFRTIAAPTLTLPPAISATASVSCIPEHTRRDPAFVQRVLDGDSIEADIRGVVFVVRYLGTASPDSKLDPAGADAAAAQNRTWVAGRTVTLIRDVSDVDRYGRLLRYVLAEDVFVNERLVRGGFSRMTLAAPDLSCEKIFSDAEQAARNLRSGVWRVSAAERTKTALSACVGACLTPSPGCRIKGNINAKGEKIFHLPGARGYAQTIIEPAKGERWFCSEAEAVEAGWRKG